MKGLSLTKLMGWRLREGSVELGEREPASWLPGPGQPLMGEPFWCVVPACAMESNGLCLKLALSLTCVATLKVTYLCVSVFSSVMGIIIVSTPWGFCED